MPEQSGAGRQAGPKRVPLDLVRLKISREMAAEHRWRFGAMAEDWGRPEMAVYDLDYLGTAGGGR